MSFESAMQAFRTVNSCTDEVFGIMQLQIQLIREVLVKAPELEGYAFFNQNQQITYNNILGCYDELKHQVNFGRYRDAGENALICANTVGQLIQYIDETEFLGDDHKAIMNRNRAVYEEFQQTLRRLCYALSE